MQILTSLRGGPILKRQMMRARVGDDRAGCRCGGLGCWIISIWTFATGGALFLTRPQKTWLNAEGETEEKMVRKMKCQVWRAFVVIGIIFTWGMICFELDLK